jgi:hypothetical protein
MTKTIYHNFGLVAAGLSLFLEPMPPLATIRRTEPNQTTQLRTYRKMREKNARDQRP